jgi:glycosyltransferase involved in cell wall biosynthesis
MPPASSPFPTISVVVPNYNGGRTLRGTLDSLLSQNYPRLEIFVIDGGSTDDSVAIIREYEDKITWWESDKDRGQSHAINKGFARCTGDIVNWLCSDDMLLPGALHAIGEAFAQDAHIDAVVGTNEFRFLDSGSTSLQQADYADLDMLPLYCPFSQPACYYRRDLLDRPGPLDESLHYCMDLELWTYFHRKGIRWKIIDRLLSVAQMTGMNKMSTCGPKFIAESERVYRRYVHEPVSLMFWQRHVRFPLEKWRARSNGKSVSWRWIGRSLQILTVVMLGPFYGFQRVRRLNWGNWI